MYIFIFSSHEVNLFVLLSLFEEEIVGLRGISDDLARSFYQL